jgi:hypothetical protein
VDKLNDILKFVKKNNNYSDYNLIQKYANTLNFNKLRGGFIDIENKITDKHNIKEGTILFHASKNKEINVNKIKIGDTDLFAYFTNDFDTALNTINFFNSKKNYIHVFKAKKNIDNLVMDISNNNNNNNLLNQYGGICFKFPRENRIQRIKNNLMINNNLIIEDSSKNNNLEIAFFDIKENLEYLYSLNCENIK